MPTKTTLWISLAILVGGGALTAFIFMTEPTAERTGAVRETAMLVDVVEAESGTFYPTIQAMGTVEPARDVTLSPRVQGEVVRIAPAFTPGGFVQRGQLLLQIDPADYRNTLLQRQSALRQALADLAVEQGRQTVARRDFELLGDQVALQDRDLVLREPQLEMARSRVAAAEAAVEQAQLDLDRTTIRAPFDAQILTRSVDVGSLVGPGDDLARLVGLDTYWVVATVPQSQLRWLTFPTDASQAASRVQVRNRTAWPENEYRVGTLHRLVGALEAQTRLARVIVDVPDPMAYRDANANAPPLMIGSFVEANIEARPLEGVVRLDRTYVRDDETVWVMEEGVLRIRPVDIIFQDARYAYIGEGLAAEDRIVTTNLATVVDGAPLRLEGTTSPAEAGALPTALDGASAN